MEKTKSIDEKNFEPELQKYVKKYGDSEFQKVENELFEADKNYHTLKKKKKVGRPRIKKKRGRPKA